MLRCISLLVTGLLLISMAVLLFLFGKNAAPQAIPAEQALMVDAQSVASADFRELVRAFGAPLPVLSPGGATVSSGMNEDGSTVLTFFKEENGRTLTAIRPVSAAYAMMQPEMLLMERVLVQSEVWTICESTKGAAAYLVTGEAAYCLSGADAESVRQSLGQLKWYNH